MTTRGLCRASAALDAHPAAGSEWRRQWSGPWDLFRFRDEHSRL